MRRMLICLLAPALLVLAVPLAGPVRAASYPPLAVRVSQAGTVTVSDGALARAGWTLPLPRDRVALSWRGQLLPLADTGSGFAFLGLPSESRWSGEAVYWLSLATTPAPRGQLPARLPTPLRWEPDVLYERHQATVRGDSWWAGELRGGQTLSATLLLPEPLPAGAPLLLHLRASQTGSGHAVSVSVGGQFVGTLTWSDPPSGAQVVTETLSLPALGAGPIHIIWRCRRAAIRSSSTT